MIRRTVSLQNSPVLSAVSSTKILPPRPAFPAFRHLTLTNAFSHISQKLYFISGGIWYLISPPSSYFLPGNRLCITSLPPFLLTMFPPKATYVVLEGTSYADTFSVFTRFLFSAHSRWYNLSGALAQDFAISTRVCVPPC